MWLCANSISLQFHFLILKKMDSNTLWLPPNWKVWPELPKVKCHHLIPLLWVEIDISINQNNNLNIKKKFVFRVKTFFNFIHQLCIEKDVKLGKKNVIYFVIAKGKTQPGCQQCWVKVTAMEACSCIKSFLSVSLLTFSIRYILQKLL